MGLWILASLLGCGSRPTPWTVEGALAPALERADTDGDGDVTEADWLALAYGSRSFADVDADRSGKLSAAELQIAMATQDPLTFDDGPTRGAPGDALQLEYFGATWNVRTLRDVLFFLAEEVHSVDPSLELPPEHRLRLAAATARLTSPHSKAVLVTLRQATADADLEWPPIFGTPAEKSP